MDSKKNSWMKIILVFYLVIFLYSGIFSDQLYRVRKGDTLWAISKKFNTNVNIIIKNNSIHGNRIKTGMLIKIPDKQSKRNSRYRKYNKTRRGLYRVKKGDTIWSICRKFKLKIKSFMNSNNLRSSGLKIGKIVRVNRVSKVLKHRKTRKSYLKWRWYRIRRGDSLWKISKKYRVSYKQLKSLNREHYRLKIGERIKIPLRATGYLTKRRTRKKRYRGRYFGKIPYSHRGKYKWPISGKIIERFGIAQKGINNGITIKSSKNARVKSVDYGVVTFSGNLRGYGKVVIVRHKGNVYSVYANLKNIYVTKGTSVAKGKFLASCSWIRKAGCYGIHFQLYYKTKPVNPVYYLG